MELSIKFLENNDIEDFQKLLKIFETVFEWKNYKLPTDAYLTNILKNENFKVIVAINKNEIIGGLTGYILHAYDIPKPSFYIYDLGVSTRFQNKGTGKKLIEFLKKYTTENNFQEIYVTTEQEDNEQAINFYRSTPISGELKVLQFNYLI